jgi:flavodoxin
MKEIIVYYSLAGTTRRYAQEYAEQAGADLCEIKEQRKSNLFTAFVPVCIQARKFAQPPIKPIGAKLEEYDVITFAAPVWAGRQAPAINSAIALLPAGKTVKVVFLFGGSGGQEEGIKKLIEDRGCTVAEVKQIKQGKPDETAAHG